MLDAGNTILAQVDSPPQGGQYPTSTWRAGDVITDTLAWDGDVAGWERIIVGLYDSDGGRLRTGEVDAVQIATEEQHRHD